MRRFTIIIPIAIALFGSSLAAAPAAVAAPVIEMTADLPAGAVCGALVLNGRVIGWMCNYNGEWWQCTGYATDCTLYTQVIRRPEGQRPQLQMRQRSSAAQVQSAR